MFVGSLSTIRVAISMRAACNFDALEFEISGRRRVPRSGAASLASVAELVYAGPAPVN
jgi:hypothetical protein